MAIFADAFMYHDLSTAAVDYFWVRWVETGTETQDNLEFVDAMSYVYDTGDNDTLKG